ncbi:MAG: hypothetical protein JWM56_372 [Candidatus Peribacteria bacterium]|nr:hypothetical protein [Candidatus Peribacteria bacterium]
MERASTAAAKDVVKTALHAVPSIECPLARISLTNVSPQVEDESGDCPAWVEAVIMMFVIGFVILVRYQYGEGATRFAPVVQIKSSAR